MTPGWGSLFSFKYSESSTARFPPAESPVRIMFSPLMRLLSETERPALAGVTRDGEKSSVTVVGRAADDALLRQLAARLEHSGIPVRGAEAGEGRVTLIVPPAQLLPALELCHRAVLTSEQ